MADLSTHYKERTPEETVNIVKQFFKDNNVTLIESDLNQAESGTWYCHVDAFKNDIKLGGSNGKGMTKEYSLASCYAELYERFCNKMWFFSSWFWMKDYMEMNKKTNGFYFDRNERVITKQEALNNSKHIKYYFDYYSNNNEDLLNATLDIITDGKYIGVPMHNIVDDNDTLEIDPRLVLRMTRSNGMAAGNTLKEALNQGISEIVEREVEDKFFKSLFEDDKTLKYYALDLDSITENNNLKETINKIKAKGYDLYLFDLSYSYNMPVIMSLLLDRQNGFINVNFGAFPVFEIAAERVLTELYQGTFSYKDEQFKMRTQIPFKTQTFKTMMTSYGNSIGGEILSTKIFDRMVTVSNYNHEIFIDKKVSNDDIFAYFQEFTKKNPAIKFYYMDNSLCKDLYAVYVFLENTEDYIPMTVCDADTVIWDQISVIQAINLIKKLKQLYIEIYENKTVNIPNLIDLIFSNYRYSDAAYLVLTSLFLWNTMFIEQKSASFNCLIRLLNSIESIDTSFIPLDVLNSELYHNYKKYYQLLSYVKASKYTPDELLHILNNLFDYKVTLEDLHNVTNAGYLLKRVYINSLREYIHSDSYKELINIYVKNNLS